jgi:hypothetical protein
MWFWPDAYGENENPFGSGAHQGSFGEAFLLNNSEVVKDLELVDSGSLVWPSCGS